MTAPACWMDNISLIGVIIFSYLPLKNSLFMEACMYPFANNKAVTCIVNPDYPTELPLSLEKPRMRRSSQPFAGSSRDILAAVRLVCSVRTVTSTTPCTAPRLLPATLANNSEKCRAAGCTQLPAKRAGVAGHLARRPSSAGVSGTLDAWRNIHLSLQHYTNRSSHHKFYQ